MPTSGTIGTTRINTGKLLEKAIRRCGLLPSALTPEIIESAKEDLLMLLMSISNRGLNLWCVDEKLIPLVEGKKTYALPIGTTDILNLNHCLPGVIASTTLPGPGDGSAYVDNTTPVSIDRFALEFSANPIEAFEFQGSFDDTSWATIASFQVADLEAPGTLNWKEIDGKTEYRYYRVWSSAFNQTTSPVVITLSSSLRETPISQFNRDDYANQPSKSQRGEIAVGYWFEKIINPQVTLWPVPGSNRSFLRLYRYRQIQDIGSLIMDLEIPIRWYESITWQLAERLAFSIPGVDPTRRAEVIQMASRMILEVEPGETDGAPVMIAPNIGVYTA